jgi:hypothetical protein
MTSQFLTQLADQLKRGKNPAQRRAIGSVLPLVAARFEEGRYRGRVDAESELRTLIDKALSTDPTKPV